jgi:putative transcriptional regulator
MTITRRSSADIDRTPVDWSKIPVPSDEEIDAQIAADPDTAPILTDEELARARVVFPPPRGEDVKLIRGRLGLSQEQFAKRFGFSVETIRNYEQGHRQPNGPARTLLRVIANEPEAVARALRP